MVSSPAVVGAVGLDAAAFGAFVDHLSRLELQAFYELLGGVPFGDGALRGGR